MDMTLREVCTATNVSRRAVQGYEKAGLVRAPGKTNRGYLIYNEETGTLETGNVLGTSKKL